MKFRRKTVEVPALAGPGGFPSRHRFSTPSFRPRRQLRRCVSTLLLGTLLVPGAVRARSPLLAPGTTRSSLSGQFVVIGENPSFSSVRRPAVSTTNTEFVRLEPALLAVSAERVKRGLWRELGIDPLSPWRGRIFLALHPARSLNETVAIVSRPLAGVWNYRVELPDIVSRTRLTRALTAVVLLELANRDNAGARSAEIPAWLTEGLAQQLLATGAGEMIVSAPGKLAPVLVPSAPGKLVNGVPENRINVVQRGVDPLAKARAVLHDHPALTLEQLSWPDNVQLRGEDGGVYRASAQLFVSDLLALKDGAANLRAMLSLLPRCYNWQIAFRAAFRADFPQPIDADKWWALQIVSFDAREAGPEWTPAASRAQLDTILRVPVEMRFTRTNLPVHAAISLQDVIRNFDFGRQTAILQAKLRELDLAHWRMAPQFVALTDAYRRVLTDYLGGQSHVVPASGRLRIPPPGALSRRRAVETLKRLDALDAQRRALETAARQRGSAPLFQ